MRAAEALALMDDSQSYWLDCPEVGYSAIKPKAFWEGFLRLNPDEHVRFVLLTPSQDDGKIDA